jgi:hypothetical protein
MHTTELLQSSDMETRCPYYSPEIWRSLQPQQVSHRGTIATIYNIGRVRKFAIAG